MVTREEVENVTSGVPRGNPRIDHALGLLAALLAERDALQAKLDAQAKSNEWRRVVIDALVVGHIYSETHDDNPTKALHDLLAWETTIALDPAVSSDAQALVDKGAKQQAKSERIELAKEFAMAIAHGGWESPALVRESFRYADAFLAAAKESP